ncbi:F-box/kelch-repeat protein At3g23880-like [Lotus japonicus]|uniref:F-box/kelch-repeat protein At3g23880-like n=1 Tax=Lotus japonicus TaxID=34305 RepID=UPI0025837F21|nr:F-box/kelch-repeat protein At3g23880-like [Lotus japonicus]
MEPPPFLCEELQLEILSWLPVKSLVRFKCVSKSWNSTISDSQFIKLHLHRSSSTRRNTDFAYIRSLITWPPESPSATTVTIPDEYDFSGTCNGVMCLSTYLVHERERERERDDYISRVCLWNPATRSMSQHSPPLRFTSTSCWSFGFGYDSSTDTYKVVVAVNHSWPWFREKTMVNVYNMGHTCWRTYQLSHLPSMYPDGDAVHVSNTLNWVAILPEDGTELINPDRCIILSFDLGRESCVQLSLPYCTRDFNHYGPILGVLRGCLCICQTYKKTRFEIWQMKEFGMHESWTRLFNITGYESIIQNIRRWPCFAMYMSEKGDALLLSRSSWNPLHAVLCTQEENKLEVTDIIANNIVDCYVNNYIESLVSPYEK